MKNSEISQFDRMTGTPVARLVVRLSIPTIISMLVTNIYNLVDTEPLAYVLAFIPALWLVLRFFRKLSKEGGEKVEPL